MEEEVFPWLKSMALAPEYRPTLSEFQDPISYIYKIEEEASRYGICKIILPIPASPKKAIIANLNQSMSSVNPYSLPMFTTRQQQVGFAPGKHRRPPIQRQVWQSGVEYTLPSFKAEAKRMEKKHLKKEGLMDLEIETMYWKAQANRPITVEYANDVAGSAFEEIWVKQGKTEVSDVMTVGESDWNVRRVARSNGSLLKFAKEDIPGVTSPMVYLGMLYSWFAWHVEDHDLHSLNYMHMGAGKTWYGVPMDAAFAFEEVIREQAYGGKISPLVAFATLAGKTTILSPEVLIQAGVPCYRLVQNAGEFVVTFPRAYHSGCNHGFNCAEAVNMATPGWLRVAKEAAIRRVSIDSAPMFSDSQLLYDLAMSLSSSKLEKSSTLGSQSSRLKGRIKSEGDALVIRMFVKDVMLNNAILDALGNGSPISLLSEDVLKSLVPDGFNLNADDSVVDRRPNRRLYSSYDQPNKKVDPASIFSCVTCGSPCYWCVAIVQPSKTAAHYIMSNEDVNVMLPGFSSVANRKTSLIGIKPMGSVACEKDSSRMHIFCLEHAFEVEQRLKSVGGVHMLLLCHQDYPEINDVARVMDKELGIFDDILAELGTFYDMWTDLEYKDITEQDKTMIRWALDDEETTATGDQDWAVKLGIDIFYSAKLGCSLNKKQMPNNAVIYKAFRQHSPSNDQMRAKQSGRQKKTTVAGSWCGKVEMSDRVHPLLLARDDNQLEDHQTVFAFPKMNVNHEKQLVVKTNVRERKKSVKIVQESNTDSEDESDYDPSKSSKRRTTHMPREAKKKACVVLISDDEEGSDGCDMSFKSEKDLKTHKQNICMATRYEKQFHLLVHDHKRVHSEDGPLKCLWQGCEKTFKWPWSRSQHMRAHKQPYLPVEDDCGQRRL